MPIEGCREEGAHPAPAPAWKNYGNFQRCRCYVHCVGPEDDLHILKIDFQVFFFCIFFF